MKPKQVERLENMVFKMDTLTQKFDEEHEDFWSQVKADIEALSSLSKRGDTPFC